MESPQLVESTPSLGEFVALGESATPGESSEMVQIPRTVNLLKLASTNGTKQTTQDPKEV